MRAYGERSAVAPHSFFFTKKAPKKDLLLSFYQLIGVILVKLFTANALAVKSVAFVTVIGK